MIWEKRKSTKKCAKHKLVSANWLHHQNEGKLFTFWVRRTLKFNPNKKCESPTIWHHGTVFKLGPTSKNIHHEARRSTPNSNGWYSEMTSPITFFRFPTNQIIFRVIVLAILGQMKLGSQNLNSGNSYVWFLSVTLSPGAKQKIYWLQFAPKKIAKNAWGA